MFERVLLAGGIVISLSWGCMSALAEVPESEDTWNAIVRADENSKSCYATAQFNSPLRGQKAIEIFVNYVPALPGRGWLTTLQFPTLAEGSKVVMAVDDRTFEFTSKNDTAWLGRTADEDRIVEAMKRAETIRIRVSGPAAEGAEFRLNASGLKAALEVMAKNCRDQ